MLGKLLGKGSDGEIYELEGDLCVKYIQPKVCGIENYLECYIMLYAQHPNIVKAKEIQITDYNLVKIIQQKAKSNLCVKIKNKMKIFKQIVESVRYLSNHGIIHGDIKPSNILLFEDETIKLNDLSLCRFVESKSTKQLYTFHYRAPEIDKGTVSLKSDVYSLGCALYEIYFNEPYHDKRILSRLHIERKPSKNNIVFLDLIYKMTNESLDDRYTIEEVSKHEYFEKETFVTYKSVDVDNYKKLNDMANMLNLSPTFVSKCMNEKINTCVNYKDTDEYVSSVLKFNIFDYVFK